MGSMSGRYTQRRVGILALVRIKRPGWLQSLRRHTSFAFVTASVRVLAFRRISVARIALNSDDPPGAGLAYESVSE